MEADLKTPSSPSRITPTRAIDDAESQMSKPHAPEPKYPYAVDEAGVARVGYVAVDPAQHRAGGGAGGHVDPAAAGG
jgi:hypothetical protein